MGTVRLVESGDEGGVVGAGWSFAELVEIPQ